MKQSLSWEANPFSADQEIPYIVWNIILQFGYKTLTYT